MLGDGAQLLLDRYGGDLRRMHEQSETVSGMERRLQELPGIGPTGAAIFCREAQGVWTDLAPYADKRVIDGARRLRLPSSPAGLADLVSATDLPRLTAACVRAGLDDDVAADVGSRDDPGGDDRDRA